MSDSETSEHVLQTTGKVASQKPTSQDDSLTQNHSDIIIAELLRQADGCRSVIDAVTTRMLNAIAANSSISAAAGTELMKETAKIEQSMIDRLNSIIVKIFNNSYMEVSKDLTHYRTQFVSQQNKRFVSTLATAIKSKTE